MYFCCLSQFFFRFVVVAVELSFLVHFAFLSFFKTPIIYLFHSENKHPCWLLLPTLTNRLTFDGKNEKRLLSTWVGIAVEKLNLINSLDFWWFHSSCKHSSFLVRFVWKQTHTRSQVKFPENFSSSQMEMPKQKNMHICMAEKNNIII